MRSLVPVGHFRNISGHLFIWPVCGSFQWRHGLLFTDCIVWDDKDKVIGFKKIKLDPLRMMEYRVSKPSTVSIITAFTRHQRKFSSSNDCVFEGTWGTIQRKWFYLRNLQMAAFYILMKKISIDSWWRVNAVIIETVEALETRSSIILSGSNVIF